MVLAERRCIEEELDPAGAIDEIGEDELAHLPPRHDPPGDPPRLGTLSPSFEGLSVGADRCDLVPVGKALRQ